MTKPSRITAKAFSHTGDLKLACNHFNAGSNPAIPHILFCGGFHSTMQGSKANALHEHCVDMGWHFTRFDYRGHGQSDGAPAEFTLTDWLDDTLAIFDDFAQPSIIVGSSMGAWLATRVALRRPEKVRALLLLAAAPDFLNELLKPRLSPGDIWDLQQGNAIQLEHQYDEDPFPIKQALLDSGEQLSLLNSQALDSLICPVRMLHGTSDTDVPYDLALRMMDKMPENHDATLTLLHGADHRLSDDASMASIIDMLNTMVSKTDFS